MSEGLIKIFFNKIESTERFSIHIMQIDENNKPVWIEQRDLYTTFNINTISSELYIHLKKWLIENNFGLTEYLDRFVFINDIQSETDGYECLSKFLNILHSSSREKHFSSLEDLVELN